MQTFLKFQLLQSFTLMFFFSHNIGSNHRILTYCPCVQLWPTDLHAIFTF
uniref:Uncharacterized protein n=1 Tax=Rhizophora mucronata TaxID=61149 RepID=A0A2P2ND60_RHIMU